MAGSRGALVLEDLVPRLNAARTHVQDTFEAYHLAVKQRDELVVRAVDQGCSQRAVAEAAGVRKSRISAILAGSQPDLEDA